MAEAATHAHALAQRYNMQLVEVANAGQLKVNEVEAKARQVIRQMAENSLVEKIAEFFGVLVGKVGHLKLPQHDLKFQIAGLLIEAYAVMDATTESSKHISVKSIARLKLAASIGQFGQGLSAPLRDILADKIVQEVFGGA